MLRMGCNSCLYSHANSENTRFFNGVWREHTDARLELAWLAALLTLASLDWSDRNTNTPLTFSPLRVRRHQFVHEGHVFKPLPLSFADEFWVAAFVGPKQVQVEHHVCTPSVTLSLRLLTASSAGRGARSWCSGVKSVITIWMGIYTYIKSSLLTNQCLSQKQFKMLYNRMRLIIKTILDIIISRVFVQSGIANRSDKSQNYTEINNTYIYIY